jgi:Ca2+-binding EF-hand superfamily protein
MATTNDELIRTFKELDLNGDGQITMQEFQVAMTARGEEITDLEIESIFADADSDQDGQISLAEFTEAWNRAERP